MISEGNTARDAHEIIKEFLRSGHFRICIICLKGQNTAEKNLTKIADRNLWKNILTPMMLLNRQKKKTRRKKKNGGKIANAFFKKIFVRAVSHAL